MYWLEESSLQTRQASMRWISIVVFVCVTSLVSSEQHHRTRYDGYKVLKITPVTVSGVQFLLRLSQDETLDFWTERMGPGKAVHVMVQPERVASLLTELKRQGLGVAIVRDNVQEDLDEEVTRLTDPTTRAYNWEDYNSLSTIIGQLHQWQAECPLGFECDVLSIGQSYELRDLLVFRLRKPSVLPRKAIWLESMVHAREWLAGTTLMKVANRLITKRSIFEMADYLTDKYDWYFMPNVNPDGYEHSYYFERFWRKSRCANANSTCIGVDLNRNYEYKWGYGGASPLPCASTYRGPNPASEPEVYYSQAEAFRLRDKLLAWVSLHSYGQMWLSPYAFETDGACEYPPDYEDLMRVNNASADAIESRYGTIWTRGSFCDTLYPGSGTTSDYTYAIPGVKYSFLPELRGDRFDPPPGDIDPSFLEFWDGLVAMVLEIEKL